jgi:hypothetical protein
MGILGVLGFAFGLTGGIFSTRRKLFALTIVGTTLVIVPGLVTIVAFALVGYNSWMVGLLFGLPIIILSVLGVIFAAISGSEFT